MKNFDFSDPFQARNWLRTLRYDPVSGIRIAPNLSLPRRQLGFTFRSNQYGLRGPNACDGSCVILGTSFAMGFAVDAGKDWYDNLFDYNRWFNAGLPVGPLQWKRLLDGTYRGNRNLALLVYHPNLLPIASAYHAMSLKGQTAFEFYRWKTGWLDCWKLSRVKHKQLTKRMSSGEVMELVHHGEIFRFNSNYCYIRPDEIEGVVGQQKDTLCELASTFDSVVCLRVPIKEELLPTAHMSNRFEYLKESIEMSWHQVKSALAKHVLHCQTAEGFELSHFHGRDTHLNELGNQHLRNQVRKILEHAGRSDTLC